MAKNQSVKTEKKLRGAVLIMVLTVMFMLIILLLATLSVVSTAQNRSYSKYEENQAYYTARSALDVYVGSMLNDNDYYAQNASGARKYVYGPDSADQIEMTQGLALQLDLYRIKSHAKSWEDYLSMSDKTLFSTDTAVNPDPGPGDPDSAYPFPYMKTILPTEDFIEYEITLPDNMIHDDAYGAGAERKGITDQFGDELKATVKVEVLAREISTKNRTKDKMWIKVTTSVPYQDLMGTTSAVYQIVENPQMFDKALTSMSYTNSNDNDVIIGGYASVEALKVGNEGGIIGPVYSGDEPATYSAWETIDKFTLSGAGSFSQLGPREASYLGGGIKGQNGMPISAVGVTDEADRPVVFVNGADISAGGSGLNWCGGAAGDPLEAVDMVVYGDWDFATGNGATINGNVYVLGNLKLSGLKFETNGNVVVFGNLDMLNNINNGCDATFYVKGNADISGNQKINYDPTLPAAACHVYSPNQVRFWNPVTNAPSLSAAGSCSFSYDVEQNLDINYDITNNTADFTSLGVKITLPEITSGAPTDVASPSTDLMKYERYIPVFRSQYLKYLKLDPTDFLPLDPPEYITAKELVSTTEAERNAATYNEDKWEEFIDGTAEIFTKGNTDIEEISISGEAKYKIRPNVSAIGSKRYVKFTGNGTVHVYVPAGEYAGAIMADDGITLNFYADTDEGDIKWNVSTFTESIMTAFTTAGGLRFGKDILAIPTPRINFYVAGSGKWACGQTGHSVICGYVYAPYANVQVNKGIDSGNISGYTSKFGYGSASGYAYYYSGGLIKLPNGSTVSSNPMVFGAIVAGAITGIENNAVIAFIDPSGAEQVDTGNTLFKWQPVQYMAK